MSHKMQNLSLTLEKERVFDMENWCERPFKAFQVEGGCKYKTKQIDVVTVSVGGSIDWPGWKNRVKNEARIVIWD